MKIQITALVTAGLGCIKGDRKLIAGVRRIEDMGSYWNLVIHENRQIRVSKMLWKMEEVR